MNGDANIIAHSVTRSRFKFHEYIELMKPELTGLSVMTTLCGFYLAYTYSFNIVLFIHTAIGTLLVGGGAGALNQFIEREYDALMRRTERRPLPSGRMMPIEALIFGIAISAAGIIELSVFTNLLTGFLAVLTWSTYLFLYTPLKRITPLSTVVGGIPGAIPPMMGWVAARGSISLETWILFGILFFWQMPHFYSLAWMYRKDYARAGFKILTVTDETGVRTSKQIFFYCIGLLPVSIAPTLMKMTGVQSLLFAVVLGITFLLYASFLLNISMSSQPNALTKVNHYAHRLFFTSLVYLPVLMIVMSIDKIS
jgi:protoheme IX farnesyltransferase